MKKLKMIFLAFKALKTLRKIPMRNVKNILFAARRIKKRKNLL